MKAPKFIPMLRGRNSSGLFYVYFKIYVNRNDYTFFSTGIEIEEKHFKDERVVTIPKAVEYNQKILKMIRNLEEIYYDMVTQALNITASGIYDRFKALGQKIPATKMTFNMFFKTKLDDLEGVEKYETLRDKRQTLDILNGFKSDLQFKEIVPETMYQFLNYLKRAAYADSTRYKHKKNITWAISLAKRSRLIDPLMNPWDGLDVKRPEGTREAITLEELNRVEALSYEDDPMKQKVLDSFLFSCYTGMRFVDVQKFSTCHIQEEEGETYVRMVYEKTKDSSGAKVNLPLGLLFSGKPLSIIRKYRIDGSANERVFPFIYNARVNEELKSIAMAAKINKNLTFHMGRHTFGTLMARFYNDAVLIKELMGLKKLETAMIYIHMNPDITKAKLMNHHSYPQYHALANRL